MANDSDFLSRLLVDEDTAIKLHKTSKLLGKRPFYLKYYKTAFFEHLKTNTISFVYNFQMLKLFLKLELKVKKVIVIKLILLSIEILLIFMIFLVTDILLFLLMVFKKKKI